MQKCRMLLAILLLHCGVANATVAAVDHAADACDDAMLTFFANYIFSPYHLQFIFEVVPQLYLAIWLAL